MNARIMLRAIVIGAVLFALVLARSLWRDNASIVPSQVREAIVKGYPGMAFVPSRLPNGYDYVNWVYSNRRGLSYVLIFKHGTAKDQLDLQVERRSCPAPPKWKPKGILHVNGHALKWLHASVGSVVWRCLASQRRSFVISGVGGTRQDGAELVGYAVAAH